MIRALLLALTLAAAPVRACDTALVLAIDVSGSIDRAEYALQTEGLAEALRDPEVTAALLGGQVALTVVQWSGLGQQAVTLPWQRMLSPRHLADFITRVETQPRAFRGSDTAVGEALSFSAAQFSAVPDCRRRVIDISGDGPENAGYTTTRARSEAAAQGIEINAIAIEDMGQSAPITAFFRNWVITRGGFVVTARGMRDYPRVMREKLLRELIRPTG